MISYPLGRIESFSHHLQIASSLIFIALSKVLVHVLLFFIIHYSLFIQESYFLTEHEAKALKRYNKQINILKNNERIKMIFSKERTFLKEKFISS
jgi:hypothetical protein